MRIVLVEDCILFRDAIAKACRTEFGHDIIGETDRGREAIVLCRALCPDVLILDLGLRGADGFEVIETLQAEDRLPKTIVMSLRTDVRTIRRLDQLPIAGFVDKEASSLPILGQALTAVGRGGTFFSENFRVRRDEGRREMARLSALLTEKEIGLLQYFGSGIGDEEISAAYELSVRTIQWHRSNILRKLDLPGTRRLMTFLREKGFYMEP